MEILRLRLGMLATGLLMVGCATTSDVRSPAPTSAPIPKIEPERSADQAYYSRCNGQTVDLQRLVTPLAQKLAGQKIPYPPYKQSRAKAAEWRDCSGNFLRFTSYLASDCREFSGKLVAPAGVSDYRRGRSNVVPLQPGARSTRDIARWFSDNANYKFQPIYYDDVKPKPRKLAVGKNLKKYRHLIRPGAVLWFARTMPTSKAGLPALFTYDSKSLRHINHMGIVVAVTRDENGDVTSLRMYHGRNPDKGSGITSLQWAYSGNSDYPPFGVGPQYLVAVSTVAPVITP